MRRVLLSVLCVAVLSLAVFAEPGHEGVAAEVIAITKAQWAAEMQNDVAAAMKNVADDYTEFNPGYPTRLDGKALTVRLAEAQSKGSGQLVAGEMANEKVQVYGDVAILSYNFVGASMNKDGEVEPQLAKSTRVYVKKNGQWWLVHANFGSVGD
jgi:ketosteroid isomerase-like protein